MNVDDFEKYVRLMAECFEDDPGIKAQLKGISNADDVLMRQYRCQLEPFFRLGCVETYGDAEGMAFGFFTDELFIKQLSESMNESAARLMESISPENLVLMQQNVSAVIDVAQPDWYKKYTGEREVYVLQAIMVSKALRGTGVFRKLMTPILDKAESKRVPVVLQTFESEHVAKYEHFGFQMMEKTVSEKSDLVCFNLMFGKEMLNNSGVEPHA